LLKSRTLAVGLPTRLTNARKVACASASVVSKPLGSVPPFAVAISSKSRPCLANTSARRHSANIFDTSCRRCLMIRRPSSSVAVSFGVAFLCARGANNMDRPPANSTAPTISLLISDWYVGCAGFHAPDGPGSAQGSTTDAASCARLSILSCTPFFSRHSSYRSRYLQKARTAPLQTAVIL
jgi:hypothetical protein